MTEPRVFRTLAVPLGIAVLFLVFTPKLCQRTLVIAKQRRPMVVAPSEPGRSGLIISSSTPAPGSTAAKVNFPPGLDAPRVQYLMEVDRAFGAPMTLVATDGAPITRILLDRQYIEKQPDGALTPTHEGLINVNGTVASPSGLVVPVGQRKFVGVTGIDDAGDGRYIVTVRWHWEPSPLSASLMPKPEDHHLKAEFAGGPDNWVLSRFITEPDNEFR